MGHPLGGLPDTPRRCGRHGLAGRRRPRARDRPTPDNVQDYLVFENLARRLNVPKFAERASAEDSPMLRTHLREHVFIVKAQPDKGRWQPKARALERIVFTVV
jgi:hypothetical protein